jgi:CRISPR/Cas system-associated exonuclease Cas4 (RecB family)
MLTLQQLRAEPHISVSTARMHIACPRSQALKAAGVEPAFRPVAFALGTSIHHAVGFWLMEHGAGRQPRRAEALDVLREALKEELHGVGAPVLLEDDETEEDLHAKAASMLSVVLDELPKPSRVIGVEVPFRLELADENGLALEVPLVGAIDAITEENGVVVFLELKTSKKIWSLDQIATDLQLTAYARALREQGYRNPKPRLLVVTKGKVPKVQLESPRYGVQQQRDLVAIISGVLKAIRAGVEWPNRQAWNCKTCPYARACR